MSKQTKRQPKKEPAAPKAAPQTDPTNTNRQESAAEWECAEEENGRRLDEPGLTDKDRQHRD